MSLLHSTIEGSDSISAQMEAPESRQRRDAAKGRQIVLRQEQHFQRGRQCAKTLQSFVRQVISPASNVNGSASSGER